MKIKLFPLLLILFFSHLVANEEKPSLVIKKGECYSGAPLDYLHIHYLSLNGDCIELSNGRLYKINYKYTPGNVLTWNYSDKVEFYREGAIIWGPLLLRNKTTYDYFAVSLVKP